MSINKVQTFLAEVSTVTLLEQYLRLAITTALTSYEEVAVKTIDCSSKNLGLSLPPVVDRSNHFPVILISGLYSPQGGRENTYFGGYKPWETFRFDGTTSAANASINRIKELLSHHQATWEEQFRKKFGVDSDDDLGYELRSVGWFPEWLAISLIRMRCGQ